MTADYNSTNLIRSVKECDEIIHFWHLAWCLAHTLLY